MNTKDFDILKYPDLVNAINEGIRRGDDLNLKYEPKGITLVRMSRKVIYREQ